MFSRKIKYDVEKSKSSFIILSVFVFSKINIVENPSLVKLSTVFLIFISISCSFILNGILIVGIFVLSIPNFFEHFSFENEKYVLLEYINISSVMLVVLLNPIPL